MVVSAMGGKPKVTDLLLKCVSHAATGNLEGTEVSSLPGSTRNRNRKRPPPLVLKPGRETSWAVSCPLGGRVSKGWPRVPACGVEARTAPLLVRTVRGLLSLAAGSFAASFGARGTLVAACDWLGAPTVFVFGGVCEISYTRAILRHFRVMPRVHSGSPMSTLAEFGAFARASHCLLSLGPGVQSD